MDIPAIQRYLEQVAPIPFAPEFSFGTQIDEALKSQVNLGNVKIMINDGEHPLFRPFRDEYEARKGVGDHFHRIQHLSIPGSDGTTAAVGWILHHGYLGAFPTNSPIRGLRLRSGNLQIGEADLLDEVFPESRFNSWAVGEVHILDNRILPNGRRDHFEQNVHFRNVLGQLSPIARDLSRLCRDSSLRRNWIRKFEQGVGVINARLAVLRQGAITKGRWETFKDEIVDLATHLEKIAKSPVLDAKTRAAFHKRIVHLQAKLQLARLSKPAHEDLKRFRGGRRRLVQRFADVVYDVVPNPAAAKIMIDKILHRL
jgi:molecular chaperone HtpG